MRIDELSIHPLAQAALRYFTIAEAAETSGLDRAQFLELLKRSLTQLQPAEIQRAGNDLVNVARFLKTRGMLEEAAELAEHVSKAAKSKLVETGATALLGPDPPRWIELPPVPAQAPTIKRPRLIESQWDAMSDARRRRLAELAEELTLRTQTPREESAKEGG